MAEQGALAEAVRLLEYALNLRMYGEGKGETWADFDASNERFLRSLPRHTPSSKIRSQDER